MSDRVDWLNAHNDCMATKAVGFDLVSSCVYFKECFPFSLAFLLD